MSRLTARLRPGRAQEAQLEARVAANERSIAALMGALAAMHRYGGYAVPDAISGRPVLQVLPGGRDGAS